MKKVLIAMSVACVSVCAALADSSSAYESLKFRTNAWFSLTKDNMASPVGGSITSGTLTPVGDKLAFNDAVVFTATEERTNDITTVTLDVVASVVPSDEKKQPDAGIAVALCETSAGVTNFIAWLGADWETLTANADVIPGIGESYKMVVRFDNRGDQKKVKFAAVIDDTEYVLKDAGDNEWLTYASSVGKQLHVGFLGDGALTRFDGDQLVILAEAVIAGGEIVDVKETDVKNFSDEATKLGKSLPEYMASNAKGLYTDTRIPSALTVAQAYALGLITTQNDGALAFPNGGALEIRANAVAANANGDIKVGFIDVVPNTESGATFSYKVYASADGTDWGEPVATYQSLDAVVIPHGQLSGGKFFKVVTEVTLKAAQQ